MQRRSLSNVVLFGRKVVRQLIPRYVLIQRGLLRRYLNDRKSGYINRFANKAELPIGEFYRLELTQKILPSSHFQNKIYNIKKGAKSISEIVIQPGEILSFWRGIGPPTIENGFRKGRNLINGILTEDFGGGLCQLSGILYHLSLMAGLKVIERHHHSVDIYKEDERYSPLGADATVVYGYKDLRMENGLNTPIWFSFKINDESVTATLNSKNKLDELVLDFKRTETANLRTVDTTATDKAGNVSVLEKSVYTC